MITIQCHMYCGITIIVTCDYEVMYNYDGCVVQDATNTSHYWMKVVIFILNDCLFFQ